MNIGNIAYRFGQFFHNLNQWLRMTQAPQKRLLGGQQSRTGTIVGNYGFQVATASHAAPSHPVRTKFISKPAPYQAGGSSELSRTVGAKRRQDCVWMKYQLSPQRWGGKWPWREGRGIFPTPFYQCYRDTMKIISPVKAMRLVALKS